MPAYYYSSPKNKTIARLVLPAADTYPVPGNGSRKRRSFPLGKDLPRNQFQVVFPPYPRGHGGAQTVETSLQVITPHPETGFVSGEKIEKLL